MNLTHLQYHSALRSNLGLALYLLPSALRGDALLFYNFCHDLDEQIDGSFLSTSEKESLLSSLLVDLERKNFSSKKLKPTFAAMIERRHLDCTPLCDMIRGLQMDLTTQRYATFEELRQYAWRVASTVGLMSVQLFELTGEYVNDYAETLGIALQLTNILRDVAEDAARDRIYLPLEDLERFRVSQHQLLTGMLPPSATHLFHYQAERAFSYFAKAERAWEKLTTPQRRKLRPARLMDAIYRELLQKMKSDCFDLFYRRYQLSLLEKARLAWFVFFH